MDTKENSLLSRKRWKRFLTPKSFFLSGLFALIIYLGFEFQDDYRKFGKFRTMQDPLQVSDYVDLRGLKELKIAGGPLINFTDLEKNFGKEKLYIVNAASHDYMYVDGFLLDHLDSKKANWKNALRRIYYLGSFSLNDEHIVTEKEAAEKRGYTYINLPIMSKYPSPDKNVDAFVNFFDSLPQDAAVFFHCRHGKGRTSMYLIMADIMRNAPQVALSDIVKRQHLLGSVDIFDVAVWKKGTYTENVLENRKAFIEKFYQFVCQRKKGGFSQWSAWHTQWKSMYEGD